MFKITSTSGKGKLTDYSLEYFCNKATKGILVCPSCSTDIIYNKIYGNKPEPGIEFVKIVYKHKLDYGVFLSKRSCRNKIFRIIDILLQIFFFWKLKKKIPKVKITRYKCHNCGCIWEDHEVTYNR